ncbi:hypothetical protein [Clostridium saccharoperbutylacetonicum]|uniref:hypothetical protein n=1 Tax=Clostridium saccharoperbutylacetonicum TaxID=36745 RepID=UPI0039E80717
MKKLSMNGVKRVFGVISSKITLNYKSRNAVAKVLTLAFCGVMSASNLVYAAGPNIGQSASNWVLDNVFWLGIAGTCVIAAMFVIKKNAIKMFSTIIIGGFVCAVIKQPTLIQTWGKDVIEILGLSS